MKYLIVLMFIVLSACGSKKGDTGAKGKDGLPGATCELQTVDPGSVTPYGGVIITCDDISVLVQNGAPGSQGPQGAQGVAGPTSSYSIVDTIDPCGHQGSYDEIFLVLGNGTIIWSFSDSLSGQNTRLSQAVDGSFMTSDGTNCSFTVSTLGNVRTVTWSGGSKSVIIQ